MSSRHFDALAYRKDGSFALAGSCLTGNTWDGSLWYFNSWEHYTQTPNLDFDAVNTSTGHSDIEWFNDSELIVASDSGDLGVWHLVAPGNVLQCHAQLCGMHNDMVLSVCVTGQKKDDYVISGGGDGRIVVWDMAMAKPIHKYRGHVGWVNDIASHPTQPMVFLSTSMDKQIKVWDTRQSSPVTMSVQAPNGVSCQCLSWSAQDDTIACGDESGYLHVHDLRDFIEHPPLSFELHSLSVHRISFSDSFNGIIASVSDDKTSKLFSVLTKSVVCSNGVHSDFVRGLSWQPDSSSCSFLTCSWDGHVCNNTFTGELPSLTVLNETSSGIEFWDQDNVRQMEQDNGEGGGGEGREREGGGREEDENGSSAGKPVTMETVRSNGTQTPSRLQTSD